VVERSAMAVTVINHVFVYFDTKHSAAKWRNTKHKTSIKESDTTYLSDGPKLKTAKQKFYIIIMMHLHPL